MRFLLQPIVDVRSQDILHYEVLSRPTDVDPGTSLDSYFEQMSLAEQLSLIRAQLTHFADLDIPLSINVSSRILFDSTSCYRLIEMIGDHPKPVLLEFTEGHPLPPAGDVNPYFSQLRQLGAQMALDDFGTGHSTQMDIIHNYDFDVIKIDRSMILAWDDPQRSASLRVLSRVLQMLGRVCVVEGIETSEQKLGLLNMGFNLQQGYLHGRPQAWEQLDVVG